LTPFQFIQRLTQFNTVAISLREFLKQFYIVIKLKQQKRFYMKHLGFTIQFLLLLVAIPLLMYAGIFHDTKVQSAQKPVEHEVSYSKTSMNGFVDAMHFQTIVN
jgi:hypothetical protein